MSSEERERASRVFEATITNTGERYACADKDTLLRGMEQLGRKCIPVGCRGGGCGVCKIRILSGRYRALKMSCEHVSADERASGVVLACRVFPESDISFRVEGKMCKQFDLSIFTGGATSAPAAKSAPVASPAKRD